MLETYIESFFNKTTKHSSEVETTVVRLDKDLSFAKNSHLERLDNNRTNYKIIIDPETYEPNRSSKKDIVLKSMKFGAHQNSLKETFQIFEQKPLRCYYIDS